MALRTRVGINRASGSAFTRSCAAHWALGAAVLLATASNLEAAYTCSFVAAGPEVSVTFTDSPLVFSSNELILDLDPDGFLRHNRRGSPTETFASPIDLDTATPGVQAVHISAIVDITIDAADGRDVVILLEALALNDFAAPNVIVNGGSEDDVLTALGIFPGLELNGDAGNDILTGNAGNDTLRGGAGNDTIYGFGGNDTIDGGDGNDRIYAGTGANAVTDGTGDDLVDLSENAVAVVLSTGGGNDHVIGTPLGDTITGSIGADILEGRSGDDILNGDGGADRLSGGDGNDTLTGGAGADGLFGDADADTIVWNPGDGSDLVEGGTGSDVLSFNGAAGAEVFAMSAAGARLRLTRDVGAITMDVSAVEQVTLNALAGADSITVNDLTETDVAHVRLDLGPPDAATDNVIVNGRPVTESIGLTSAAGVVDVAGLPCAVEIAGGQAAEGDRLTVNGGDGDDVMTAAAGVEGAMLVTLSGEGGGDVLFAGGAATLNGGAGADTLFGGPGVDAMSGGDGDDLLVGNPGNDTMNGDAGDDRLIWNNGDGSDVMEGGLGTDVVEVNGSPTAGDVFTIQPGGVPPRVGFARTNLIPFALDLGAIELLSINALGGDDTITASGALGALIALRIDGGAGNDTLTGADGDDLLLGDAGNDTLNGGAGVDTMRGGFGNDTLTGGAGDDQQFGEGGDDRLVWNNGDGSDRLDGGENTDIVEVNGSPAAGDQFVIAPNLANVRFDRVNLGPFGLDVVATERMAVNGLGGDDSIAVSAGVMLAQLAISGGEGNDTMNVAGGLGVTTLSLNGDAGDDTFTVVSQLATDVTAQGGAHGGGDTLTFDADCLLVAATASSLTATGRRPLAHAGIEKVSSTRTFAIAPVTFDFTSAGGKGAVNVTTGASCAWTASTNAGWIGIEGTAGGFDSGVVDFAVEPAEGPGRVGTLIVAGQTVTVTQGAASTALVSRYLPEGASSSFFKSRIALLNPNATESTVSVKFLRPDGSQMVVPMTMPPMSRRTVDASAVLGPASFEFSTVIESFPEVVADRTMTFNSTGYGSHAETSLAAPALTWQVAEGTTQPGFNTFVLLQNPNQAAAEVQLTFFRPAPALPIVRSTAVPPGSRQTLWVNVLDPGLASTNVAVSAVSTNGVTFLMERSMYLDQPGQPFSAGLDSAGVVEGALTWFLGEGATGPYFDTFVLISNATAMPAAITGTYLLPGGGTVVKNYVVPSNSRVNIWLDHEDPLLADTAVSSRFTVTNGVPVVVERSMWWPGPTAASWKEVHTSAGATATGTKWAVADGEQGGANNAQTYLLIANTSAFIGSARVTLIFEDGTRLSQVFQLLGTSRLNVDVAASFPAAAGRRFGAVVESLGSSPAQIVVERSIYSDAGGVVWAAGSNVLGTRLK